jgi:hypothetical protein
MSEDKRELDLYEQKLQDQKEILQKCQDDKKVNSCLVCLEVIGCAIRKKYVLSVYESMSKGEGGGFEF